MLVSIHSGMTSEWLSNQNACRRRPFGTSRATPEPARNALGEAQLLEIIPRRENLQEPAKTSRGLRSLQN